MGSAHCQSSRSAFEQLETWVPENPWKCSLNTTKMWSLWIHHELVYIRFFVDIQNHLSALIHLQTIQVHLWKIKGLYEILSGTGKKKKRELNKSEPSGVTFFSLVLIKTYQLKLYPIFQVCLILDMFICVHHSSQNIKTVLSM